jgi:hypothetical protein
MSTRIHCVKSQTIVLFIFTTLGTSDLTCLFCFDAGLCGFFPVHPRSYMYGWRSRRDAETQAAAEPAKSEEQKKE